MQARRICTLKFVMTILVRDEIDIIAQNIGYHRARGVDHFIVTDNLSEDGTKEFLIELERDGSIDLIHETDDTFDQGVWVSRMAQIAAMRHRADWIIHSDADEFWWPTSTSLKSILADTPADWFALQVPRMNFLPPLEDVDFPLGSMVIRYAESKNMYGKPLPPKIMHQGFLNTKVGQGNHSVSVPAGLKCMPTNDVEILHFPLRTYKQFEKKILNGGSAYGRNMHIPMNVGRAWRLLYEKLQQDDLKSYYEAEAMTSEVRAEGLSSGTLIEDSRLLSYLIDDVT